LPVFSPEETTLIANSYASGRYYETYRLIAQLSEGRAGVSNESVVWMYGAADVNQGVGSYSQLIRDYTSKQYQLRYDQALPSSSLQDASDDIARKVISDILNRNEILGIGEIATKDWRSSEIHWLLDVIAPNEAAAHQVIAGLGKVIKAPKLHVHPTVQKLLQNYPAMQFAAG
jgi:hypothetical protein